MNYHRRVACRNTKELIFAERFQFLVIISFSFRLLKGIVGRPAKRGSDKVVYKTNKAISKGFPK